MSVRAGKAWQQEQKLSGVPLCPHPGRREECISQDSLKEKEVIGVRMHVRACLHVCVYV